MHQLNATQEETIEATAKPTPTVPVEPEATQAPRPEPTSAPALPLPTKGLCGLCPCLPGLALPVLALGGVLVVRRKQSP